MIRRIHRPGSRLRRSAGLLVPLTLLALAVTTRNARALENDEQYWAAAYFQAPVVEKLRVYLEPRVRYVPNETTNRRFIARGALYYPLGAGFTVWAGYAWAPVWSKEQPARVDEHRPWQQLMHSYEERGLTLVNRGRFEQRINANSATGGPKSGVDQNRLGFAVQYAFTRSFVVEPTYMINSVNSARKAFHTALLAVMINH